MLSLVSMGYAFHFRDYFAPKLTSCILSWLAFVVDLQRKDKMAGRAQAIWTLLGTCVK